MTDMDNDDEAPAPKTKPKVNKPARRATGGNVTTMLHPGERVIRVARVSPGIYWKGIVLFLFSGLLMLNPFIFNLGVVLMFVSLIILALGYMTRYYLMLVLTDKRILIRRGIMTLDTVQLRLNRIESVELEWTPPGRIMGYSVVVITGTGSRVTAIPYIADGLQFRKDLDDLLYAQEERAMGNAAAPAATGGN